MKQAINLSTGLPTDALKNHLRTAYNVEAVPRLTVDWNYNRYTTPTASNTPSEDDEGFDIERFPIESIIRPLRPNKGAAKARVGEATAAPTYARPHAARYYVADTDDAYTYWTSPYPTNATGFFPNHTDGITSARPRVAYDRVVQTNKIVIRLENTWSTPAVHEVWISSVVGGAFTKIATNPAVDNGEGTIVLYFNGIGWVTTKPDTLVTTAVAGIEYRVSKMGPGYRKNGEITFYYQGNQDVKYTTGFNSSLNVIAIEAHLEKDLTERLISVSDTFDMSEKSQLYPIGTLTTNTAEVVLSDEDGIFNKDNTESLYYGLTEPNAEFNLEYIFTVDDVDYSVQQFKMYNGPWSSDEGTVALTLNDYTEYLKEMKPKAFLIEGKTSSEIIWRVLDSVGFVDYEINSEDIDTGMVIPVFWTTGDQTVMEVLDELAAATQTAIYVDGTGTLQVKTRDAAYPQSDVPVNWNLLGVKDGTSLPDIVTWTPSDELEANKIDVKYKTTKWKTNSLGKAAMSRVWEPDGNSLVVRSTPLKKNMDTDSDYIFLGEKDVRIWPYESKVQIDGEIIQYKGKRFIYYTYTQTVDSEGKVTYSNPVKNVYDVTDEDEYKFYNNKTPRRFRHKNHFSGAVKVVERGVWNTEVRVHSGEINNWTSKMELDRKSGDTRVLNPRGFSQSRKNSTVTINTPKRMKDANDTFWAFRGGSAQTSYKSYGTRFKFNKDKSSSTQIAGLCYQLSGARESGYYIEARLSKTLTAGRRKSVSEITIYSKVGGKYHIVSKGPAVALGEGIWYELDVYHKGTGNDQTITVFLNGQLVATGNTTATTAQGESGRFGFFARGKTNISFEYIYAVARTVREPLTDYGFYDLKYGGIRGGQWEREYVWETRTRRRKIRKRKWKKESYRHNQYVFDEFGPYVHEVREFDVKFDPSPVRYSYLFSTNEWYSVVAEYTSNPFEAKFIIANTSRENAVIHGEDSLTYAGAGSPINQVCIVLGQDLEVADEETVTRKNLPAIRARGEITSELSSDWIQSKSMAKNIAEWMTRHWSDSLDEVQVEIFGNPLIEVGDVVDVLHPLEHIAPETHVYFVSGVENTFESGLRTTLTLRRKRTATDVS